MLVNSWVIPFWSALPAVAAAGAGLAAWSAMHPAAQLFGPTIRRTGRRDAVALTFDDGPNPPVTPQLLDLLDRHHVRATFFLIGRFVRARPELAREIAARGHTVGNHTDTHPNLIWLSHTRIREELVRCEEAIQQATGGHAGRCVARWMRPPYGFRGPQLDRAVRQQGLRGVVTWSVLAYDWRAQPASRVIRRLRRVRASDIVVLHDGDHRGLGGERQHILGALEFWLPRWRDAGMEFVTMDAVGGDVGEAQGEAQSRDRN